MRLTRYDFESVLDFVRDLYDRRGIDDCTVRTISGLLGLTAAERIVFGDFDIECQSARLSMHPSIVKDVDGTVNGNLNGALSGLENGLGSHPLFRYYLQTGDGRPRRLSHVMTRSGFERYRDTDSFVRQLGARFQIGVFFPAAASRVTVMLLTRARRDFSEHERELLNLLYPHLVQSSRNAASLTRVCRGLDELFEMLESPTSSAIALYGDGRVKRWTEQARRWIAQYCRTPFPAQADRLPECFAAWYHRQLARVAKETELSPSRDPLVVDKGGRQLTVQLVPDYLRDEHLLLLNEKQSGYSWSTLGESGLTPREAEVLAWVAKGKTNADIAIILGMSGRTVQKHLEHIYQKLGVETRTAATLRALGVFGSV